jgi:hypothetical protein
MAKIRPLKLSVLVEVDLDIQLVELKNKLGLTGAHLDLLRTKRKPPAAIAMDANTALSKTLGFIAGRSTELTTLLAAPAQRPFYPPGNTGMVSQPPNHTRFLYAQRREYKTASHAKPIQIQPPRHPKHLYNTGVCERQAQPRAV